MTLGPLAELAQRPDRAAFVLDFDGTLAPIVDDPAEAQPLDAVLEPLHALAESLRLVAIVSGRPVTFLRERVPVPGILLVGAYGLERLVNDQVVLDPRARPFAPAVAAAAAEAETTWPHLLVERKGELAVTIHWRTATGAAPHATELEALAARHGLARQPGRMACELRPPVAVDKATTVAELWRESRWDAVAVAGDDHGDLAVFEWLPRAADEELGAGFHFVRIAVRSSEAPPALLAHAELVVDGPSGLAALLRELTASLRPRPA